MAVSSQAWLLDLCELAYCEIEENKFQLRGRMQIHLCSSPDDRQRQSPLFRQGDSRGPTIYAVLMAASATVPRGIRTARTTATSNNAGTSPNK
jgi:hypothetical protein